MAGICGTCGFFQANVHPGEEKPNHCTLQDMPLSEEEAGMECEEHMASEAKKKGEG